MKGFSEEWSGINEEYPINMFDMGNIISKVADNTQLVDGFIEKTLPKYLNEKDINKVAFIHIDTDTYTPAKVIISSLKPFFKRGAIIIFDEFCGYPNWRSHEFKALNETLKPEEYEFLGLAHTGLNAFLIKAAIRIK